MLSRSSRRESSSCGTSTTPAKDQQDVYRRPARISTDQLKCKKLPSHQMNESNDQQENRNPLKVDNNYCSYTQTMKMRTRERLGSTKIQDGGVIHSSCKCETEEAFINFELSEKSKIIRLLANFILGTK